MVLCEEAKFMAAFHPNTHTPYFDNIQSLYAMMMFLVQEIQLPVCVRGHILKISGHLM